jgi:hypothetical protein
VGDDGLPTFLSKFHIPAEILTSGAYELDAEPNRQYMQRLVAATKGATAEELIAVLQQDILGAKMSNNEENVHIYLLSRRNSIWHVALCDGKRGPYSDLNFKVDLNVPVIREVVCTKDFAKEKVAHLFFDGAPDIPLYYIGSEFGGLRDVKHLVPNKKRDDETAVLVGVIEEGLTSNNGSVNMNRKWFSLDNMSNTLKNILSPRFEEFARFFLWPPYPVSDQTVPQQASVDPLSVEELNGEPIYFYKHKGAHGHMSNFYVCNFSDGGDNYMCSEQYLMRKKLDLFDSGNKALAAQIMETRNPMTMQSLGHQVRGF